MNQVNDSKKRKKWKHLSERERCKIEVLLKADHTVKDIANELNRDRRTIEREIKKERGNKTNRKSVSQPKPKSPRLSDQDILS